MSKRPHHTPRPAADHRARAGAEAVSRSFARVRAAVAAMESGALHTQVHPDPAISTFLRGRGVAHLAGLRMGYTEMLMLRAEDAVPRVPVVEAFEASVARRVRP